MDKIGIGPPSTRWKGNLMGCTFTIQPTNIMNGMKKRRLIEKPKKMAGTRVKGVVKNQLEIVEVKKNPTMSWQIHSELFNYFVMSQDDIRKIIGLYNQSN